MTWRGRLAREGARSPTPNEETHDVGGDLRRLAVVLRLLEGFGDVADPGRDVEGTTLARNKERTRARASGALNNDF